MIDATQDDRKSQLDKFKEAVLQLKTNNVQNGLRRGWENW